MRPEKGPKREAERAELPARPAAEALRPDSIAAYGRQTTGEKYLIRPNEAG